MAFMSPYEQKGITINYIVMHLYISVIVSFYFATDPRADISLYYIINFLKKIFLMRCYVFLFWRACKTSKYLLDTLKPMHPSAQV